MRLILASASPRRADLLREAGIDADIRPADVDERVIDGEQPEAYVRRVADDKARAISQQTPDEFVLAADTVVVIDNEILGKPAGLDDARRMLRMLAGHRHYVVTGVSLMKAGRNAVPTQVEVTTVEFVPLSPQEIEWYIASGESTDKAGGYGIQGLASRFVRRVEGSYSNVVGLPVALVYRMCTEAGLLLF